MVTGFLKRGMNYLGLIEDEYDDDDVVRPVPEGHLDTLVHSYDLGEAVQAVTPREGKQSSHVLVTNRKRPAYSTSLSAHVDAVRPTEFADAKQIADGIMAGQPVIVNLQTANRELKRRIIDFSSGVVCGLGGAMERIASNVFLIMPSDQELSADERRRA